MMFGATTASGLNRSAAAHALRMSASTIAAYSGELCIALAAFASLISPPNERSDGSAQGVSAPPEGLGRMGRGTAWALGAGAVCPRGALNNEGVPRAWRLGDFDFHWFVRASSCTQREAGWGSCVSRQ